MVEMLGDEEQLQAWAQPVYNDLVAAGPMEREAFPGAVRQTLNLLNSDDQHPVDVDELLQALNFDGDGEVSYEEFLTKIKEALSQWPHSSDPPPADPILIQDLIDSDSRLREFAKQYYQSPLERTHFKAALKPPLDVLNSTTEDPADTEEILSYVNLEGKGNVTFDEYVKRLLQAIYRLPSVEAPQEEEKDEEISDDVRAARLKDIVRFEKYVEASGIAKIFQIIFAEVVTKKIEPANVFAYTAMRLRQIGKEVAHLLPPELAPAQTDVSTSLAAA